MFLLPTPDRREPLRVGGVVLGRSNIRPAENAGVVTARGDGVLVTSDNAPKRGADTVALATSDHRDATARIDIISPSPPNGTVAVSRHVTAAARHRAVVDRRIRDAPTNGRVEGTGCIRFAPCDRSVAPRGSPGQPPATVE